MIISHKHKFIFIKTAKTAGTSIEVFLERICDDDDIVTPIFPTIEGHRPRNYQGLFNPVPEMLGGGMRENARTLQEFVKRKKFYNHISARKVRARVPSHIWNNYYKFAVERNPWDKTMSHYHMLKHRSGRDMSFQEYLNMGNFCLNYQKYTAKESNYGIIVDRVIKYENLIEELGEVFSLLNIPFSGDLGVKAKSDYRKKTADYRGFFSELDRQFIADVFRAEIQMFGYEFY